MPTEARKRWAEKLQATKCITIALSCAIVAEAFAANIKKGDLVAVSGEFYIEEWEKTGNKHQKPCLKINQIQLTKKMKKNKISK